LSEALLARGRMDEWVPLPTTFNNHETTRMKGEGLGEVRGVRVNSDRESPESAAFLGGNQAFYLQSYLCFISAISLYLTPRTRYKDIPPVLLLQAPPLSERSLLSEQPPSWIVPSQTLRHRASMGNETMLQMVFRTTPMFRHP
jgi:hypothetical protein